VRKVEEVAKLVISYGVFAVLFCLLLKYVLEQNKTREEKYQKTIEKNQTIISKLADNFNVVEDVKRDVEEIKDYLRR